MWLGEYPEDYTTVVCMFTTHDANGAPVAPLTAFEAADVRIYKNGVNTEKTSTNGVTMTSPFDTVTGLHCLVIDTSNDTGDSGFWTTGGGSIYTLVLVPDTETVNSQTVTKVIGQFGITLSAASQKLTTTRAEPGQGAPAATTDPLTKLDWLYKAWRNKKTQTSTTFSLFADDASTVDQKSTVTDDATTATRGEIASGP